MIISKNRGNGSNIARGNSLYSPFLSFLLCLFCSCFFLATGVTITFKERTSKSFLLFFSLAIGWERQGRILSSKICPQKTELHYEKYAAMTNVSISNSHPHYTPSPPNSARQIQWNSVLNSTKSARTPIECTRTRTHPCKCLTYSRELVKSDWCTRPKYN